MRSEAAQRRVRVSYNAPWQVVASIGVMVRMDPVGPTSDKIADQRAQIRAALEKHAPAVANGYDAAVRLVRDETFPWRLRLVAHAVREIANALPEELLG